MKEFVVLAAFLLFSQCLCEKEARLHFLLNKNGLNDLEHRVEQIYDPKSSEFGRYLSLEQLKAIVGRGDAEIGSFISFLQETANAHSFEVSPTKDHLTAVVSVEDAENFVIPDEFTDLVGHIGRPSASGFRHAKPKIVFGGADTNPAAIWNRYSVEHPPKISPNYIQSIASFLEQYVSASDLETFCKNTLNQSCAVEKFVGPNEQQHPGGEAMLDIEYIMGLGQDVRTWVWNTEGRDPYQEEPFLQFLFDVSSNETQPQLFSISYGDYEDTIDSSYIKQVNTEFMKLASRGISVLVGSGDSGVSCTKDCKTFRPIFLADSPYVTSVGATVWSYSATGEIVGESATSWSGGGFSNIFDRPDFQDNAVSDYLTKHSDTPTSYFNTKGRASPDLTCIGTNFYEILGGRVVHNSGTSASTPTVAGIISLLNNLRIGAGLPTLGCLNPFLYWAAEQDDTAFIDITEGENKDGCCAHGFKATPGWDGVSGLGAMYYPTMSRLALQWKKSV